MIQGHFLHYLLTIIYFLSAYSVSKSSEMKRTEGISMSTLDPGNQDS